MTAFEAIEQLVIPVGPLQTNCYVLGAKGCKEVVLVDPGADSDLLVQQIEAKNLVSVAIILTHGHFDHFGAAAELQERFEVPVYLNRLDWELAQAAPDVALEWTGAPIRLPREFTDIQPGPLTLAGVEFEVLATPGHSPGSISLCVPGACWVGDVLFYESVGRWDFPGGDYETLMSTLEEKLLVLPEETRIFPGHGPATTLQHERRANPYL